MSSSENEPIRVVDLFSGGGGCSTGAAEACKDLNRDVELVAVNHSDAAIETHKQNHPWATHYCKGIDQIKPIEVFPEGDIDLLIAAPSCTHHSKARGGKPVNAQERMAPFAVLDWIAQLNPKSVLIENVPEFKDWAPAPDGQPVNSGTFFDAWVDAVQSLGYTVNHRVLTAADYGDPTTRERLFVIARRDDAPVWPTQTHSNDPEDDLKDWRSAAEIIDWNDRGQSIWSRGLAGNGKQPLAWKTMRRIAEGIRRYGDDSLEPFADALDSLGKQRDAENYDVPSDFRRTATLQENIVAAEDVAEAVKERDDPFLVQGSACVLDSPDDGTLGLCPPTVKGQHGGSVPRRADEQPVPTVTTDGNLQLYTTDTLSFIKPRNGARGDLFSNAPYKPDEQPVHTVTASNHDGHLVTPYLVPLYSEREGQRPRTHDLEEPLPTVTATGSDPYVSNPFLVEYYGNSDACDLEEPLPTVTTRNVFGLVVPELYPLGLDIKYRMLKPTELAAAQGFPEVYEFAGGTKKAVTCQIGNAVPVNMATALCKQLLDSEKPTLQTFASSDSQQVAPESSDD